MTKERSSTHTCRSLIRRGQSSVAQFVQLLFLATFIATSTTIVPPLLSIAIAHCFARDECPMVGWATVSVWACWLAACWHSSLAKQCGLLLFHHWGLPFVLSRSLSWQLPSALASELVSDVPCLYSPLCSIIGTPVGCPANICLRLSPVESHMGLCLMLTLHNCFTTW
jgi:hypothetical protein